MRRLLAPLIVLVCFQIGYAADFQPAFEKVILPHEGGYQKIRSDNGNWTGCRPGKGILKGTKGGISACTYPKEDIKNLSRERIAFLYKRDLWDANHLSECRLQTVADRLLDAIANNGAIATIWAKRAFNRSNGVHKDLSSLHAGLSSADIKAINSVNQARFLLCFLGYRYMRYDTLADKYPQFFDTWIDREVDEVITAVHDRDALLKKEVSTEDADACH